MQHVGELEGFVVPVPNYSVLDRDDLYLIEGNPWVDSKDIKANPWVVPDDTTVMVVEVLDVQEKEKGPSSDISNWYF